MPKKTKKESVSKKNSKKTKKGFSISEQYRLAWNYLRNSENYVILVAAFFLFAIFIGFILPILAPADLVEILMNWIKKWVEEVIKETEGLGLLGMFWFIFKNNVLVGFVAIVLGLFLGAIPGILLFANGLFIGVISFIVVNTEGFTALWRLFPHGIFEIPAIIISFALGMKIYFSLYSKNSKDNYGVFVFGLVGGAIFSVFFIFGGIISVMFQESSLRYLSYLIYVAGYLLSVFAGSLFFSSRLKKRFKSNCMNSLRVFLLVIVPLLFVAAIIEAVLISFGS